jgi:hypothetical protein
MKKITVTTIVATILTGIVAVSVLPVEAHGPPHIHEMLDALNNILAAVSGTSTEVSNIEAKLDDPNFGLQEIKNEVNNIEGKLDGTVPSKITDIDSAVGAVKTETDKIQMVKDDVGMIKAKTDNLPTDPADNSQILDAINALSLSGGGYVPFKTVAMGLPATCDEAGGVVADEDILVINGASDFMVTGVILSSNGVDDANDQITVSLRLIDGTNIEVESVDLTGLVAQGVRFDIAGAPGAGSGVFPTTIVADGVGGDIVIAIRCAAGATSDITFPTGRILVSGWKSPTDTITATYSET